MTDTIGTATTLGDVLAFQARTRPDDVAVRFIEPGGRTLEESTIEAISFDELAHRAASLAQALVQCSEIGDRALIVCPPGLDYVVALFASLFAGLVAVPAYPPTAADGDERLRRLVKDCSPRAFLSTSALAPICEASTRGGLAASAGVSTVAVDCVDAVDSRAPIRASSPDSLTLLQYTSGSTGDPRGVMLTHSNFLANIRSIAAHLGLTSDTAKGVFWLPPYHDMGLIGGILSSVVLGGQTTLMSPLSFLSNPFLWLEAVSRFQGTFSAAPNFAFDLCVRKAAPERMANLELSSWRSVVNGAEPVQLATMERFAQHFARVGLERSALMPCYGLAEATLLVSAARLDVQSAPADGVVSVGVPGAGEAILVVDPVSSSPCAEGGVGEIWLQSSSVAEGYWNNRAATQEVFAAALREDPGAGAFLRTGDLGFLRDGELHVTGRVKDVLIVRGRNYYPHDLENTAIGADARLRPGCIAAFEGGTDERREPVIVAELGGAIEDGAGEEIWQSVRRALLREHGLALGALVLIERGASLKTSSGKIRRSATRQAYLDGELEPIATHRLHSAPESASAPPSTKAISLADVCSHVASVLEDLPSQEIDPDAPFQDLGFDSLRAMELTGLLSQASGLELPSTLIFDYPTPAAVAQYLRSRLEGSERGTAGASGVSRSEDPIAIVGMSCRYPGGVRSARELWELLASGGDGVTRLPADRDWDLEGLYSPDPEDPGTAYVRDAGSIDGAPMFDSDFFGFSPREALAMDPQQRLLLEGTWEAFEDAGIVPESLRGSSTGVFAGVIPSDYGLAGPPSTGVEGFRLTGSTTSVVSGRVAYAFGLEGPAISVDTACSSSLVAIHLASQALRAGECTLALAGGVSVMASPLLLVEFSRQRGLSVDGRCRSFGAGADGVGFAEGMGLLVLERLGDARRNGHRVLALVRGSAVNQDGASNGLTAPNGPSQQRVIAQALANAGLEPHEVDVVEGHGTGTTLGDPIEAQSLLAAYGQDRESPLWLGSVKSNIGHTQAAAGVAGVIKMVQALRHEQLPKSLHCEEPSPHVDWSQGQVKLLTSPVAWPKRQEPRRAGISSFGISGTNAHLILEEPTPQHDPTAQENTPEAQHPGHLPLLLSAKTPAALTAAADALYEHLTAHPELDQGHVAATLALHRTHFSERAAILADERSQLLAGLRALGQEEPVANLIRGRSLRRRKVVFMFPGQGSQWQGMALELLRGSASFAAHMRACELALGPHVEWSLEDVLRGAPDAPSLDRVDVVQPALFAVMVSLAELWRAHGVAPDMVIGHSQGEIAAAAVAGALSLEDAARIVALRSRALSKLAGSGGMVSVLLSRVELDAVLDELPLDVSLAAVNAPRSLVLSGTPQALDALVASCEARGIRARRIAVDYASHSSQVETIREELLAELAPIAPTASSVPLYSTLTGEQIDTTELGPEYWYRSLRETVLFHAAACGAISEGADSFIEVSPHPVLTPAVSEMVDDPDSVAVIGTLRRGEGGPERFIGALAEAHVHGIEVDLQRLYTQGASLVELPSYPFAGRRYWIGPAEAASDARSLGQSPAEHPLLGAKLDLPDDRGCVYTARISVERHPWLADHTVAGASLFPASGFVELALVAGSQNGAGVLEELTLQAPLVLHARSATQIRLSLSPLEDDRESLEIAIHSRLEPSEADEEQPGWICHATGTLGRGELPQPGRLVGETWPPQGSEPIDIADLYEQLDARGLSYGPAFQGLQRAWRRGVELFGEVALDTDHEAEGARFAAHPALLDSALHLAAIADREKLALPYSFSGVRMGRRGAGAWRVRMSIDEGTISLQATDESGVPTLELDSLRLRPFDPALLQRSPRERDSMFALRWIDAPAGSGSPPSIVEVHTPDQLSSLASVPELLVCRICTGELDAPLGVRARKLTGEALLLVQAFLADERFADARLAFLTTHGVAAREADVPDPAQAPLWGLIRSAQSEHPGRLLLLDTDRSEASEGALGGALALDEPQLAIRDGRLLAARLQPIATDGHLLAPAGEPSWRLGIERAGSFDGLALLPARELRGALPEGHVRVGVRAAGVNFLDVMATLGVVDRGEDPLGSEGAGVVLEVGPGVSHLAVGDRVLGIMSGSFAPLAICDERLLARMPAGWSFEQGASVAIAFLTAHYGLVELAKLRAGESVLIHSGAGGVGMAAIQIARRLGAEVFATSSPQKWPTLESLGLDASHIASSRDHDFKDKFLRETAGRGIDVILNSLAHELTDASLELASPDGRFVEMGKTDVRDPGEVAAKHAGLAYRAFDLAEAGPARLSEMLAALVEAFASGALEPLPTTTFELSSAPIALRHLSQARHTGKVLLRIPPALDPNRTVLITGGTGALGSLLARHLAHVHGVRHLLLVSRRGASAPGAEQLVEELGASTRVLACDVSDREALRALLEAIPPEHPLGAVIHLAGARKDGVIGSIEPDDLDRAFASKLDGAVHLHELTRDGDLSAFVMFSSAAATLGSPGQGSYSAANVFLDALAARRRAEGLPAQSIAWGLWETHSEMTGDLTDAERARLGALTLSSSEGLSLFDQACSTAQPFVLAAPLDGVRQPAKRRRAQRGSFAKRLLEIPNGELEGFVLEVVRTHAAAVLGYDSSQEIEPGRAFQEVGFDSLSALEFRNRLAAETGLRLPATLAFDYPSALAVSGHLLERYSLAGARSESEEREVELQRAIASIPLWRLRSAGLLDPLLELSGRGEDRADGPSSDAASAIEGMDVEHLVARALAGGATRTREKVGR